MHACIISTSNFAHSATCTAPSFCLRQQSGVIKFWGHGTLGTWDLEKKRSTEKAWDLGDLGDLDLGDLDLGDLDLGDLDLGDLDLGDLGPWGPGTVGTWVLGTLGPHFPQFGTQFLC